jgi:ABC-type transporter Mla MlaB component
MLRITVEEEDNLTKFRLEGKLRGEWVRELERCWIYARNAGPDRQFSIDLCNVNFVDESGKTLLTRMVEQGTRLQANGPMMTSLVQEIDRSMAQECCAQKLRNYHDHN